MDGTENGLMDGINHSIQKYDIWQEISTPNSLKPKQLGKNLLLMLWCTKRAIP